MSEHVKWAACYDSRQIYELPNGDTVIFVSDHIPPAECRALMDQIVAMHNLTPDQLYRSWAAIVDAGRSL
jgi:hypothetical protein